MNALLDRFALPLLAAALAVIATAIGVWARRGGAGGRMWRTVTVGAVALVVAGTGLPHGWPPRFETGGDLVLRPGAGGLGELPVLWQDPTSLAAVLLLLNMALYVPLGFALLAGWPGTTPIRLLLAVAALAVTVELLQFLALGRVASVDDVVLNLFGAAMGLVCARAVQQARGRHTDGTFVAIDPNRYDEIL